MQLNKSVKRLTQFFALAAAIVSIGRAPLPESANACANCDSQTSCNLNTATGFGGCSIKNASGTSSQCAISGDPCSGGGS